MNSDWNFGDATSTRIIAGLIMVLAAYACSSNAGKQPDSRTPLTETYTGSLAKTRKGPGANVPFGNMQLGPQTGGTYEGTGYHYTDSIITGFLLTHTAKGDSLAGITPGNSIRFFPATGNERHATFTHVYEVVKPGYYSVYMYDIDVAVELTSTRNVGLQRYFFPPKDSVRVVIDKEIQFVNDSVATVKTSDAYYVIRLSRPPKSIYPNGESAETTLYFDATDEEMLYVKAGISFENIADAEKKIKEELPGWDFEQVAADAEKAWGK